MIYAAQAARQGESVTTCGIDFAIRSRTSGTHGLYPLEGGVEDPLEDCWDLCIYFCRGFMKTKHIQIDIYL